MGACSRAHVKCSCGNPWANVALSDRSMLSDGTKEALINASSDVVLSPLECHEIERSCRCANPQRTNVRGVASRGTIDVGSGSFASPSPVAENLTEDQMVRRERAERSMSRLASPASVHRA